MRIVLARSAVLDHFLALQRELEGRYSWEKTLLDHPVSADVDALRPGVASWRLSTDDHLPAALAGARHPEELTRLLRDTVPGEATANVVRALTSAWPALGSALSRYDHDREQAERDLEEGLRDGGLCEDLHTALGVVDQPTDFQTYLVPFAPHPPGVGLIGSKKEVSGLYIDCRRFRGAAVLDSVLTLLGWVSMLGSASDTYLSVEIARRLPGKAPYQRRLRVLVTKLVVEVTAGFLTRRHSPGHRPCVEVLGTSARFPRLFASVNRHWAAYLTGWTTRTAALDALAMELAARSPRWFVDHVDPSSLAADFYLLELMASQGDTDAQRLLGAWLPQLCSDLSVHLDAVIANELGHYERVPDAAYAYGQELAPFLASVSHGDSRVAWPHTRARLGHAEALRLAVAAFAGPGAEYGGDAWRPVAAMVRRYVLHELPYQVFIDQCFTLEHNNGSLFDKYFDTATMRQLLDAQNAGRIETLVRRASTEVRCLWADSAGQPKDSPAHRLPGSESRAARSIDTPPCRVPTLGDAPPGSVGCGSAEDPQEWAPTRHIGLSDKVTVRRHQARRSRPPLPRLASVAKVVLHTDAKEIHACLWPQRKPYTVDNFLQLARGTRPWRDPFTGETRTEPYYDGTPFHRRIPGFLIQGGDPSGTGEGGPGYRIVDEFGSEDDFSSPFVVAMANVGRDSAGGQFFITVAPTPHLAGRFAAFGTVVDVQSRRRVIAVADSMEPVRLHAVSITVG